MTAQKQTLDFPLQFRQGSIQRLAPRIDDNGPLRAQLVDVKADGLANPPLDTVAHHGFSKRSRTRKPDARPAPSGLAQAKSRKERTRKPGAFIINSPEILRSQQADTFWKTGDGQLPLGTDSEFLAAARAAA